jgi:SAM-dependent methyltransferase
VRHARILKHHGQFEFDRVREGILTDTTLARVPAGVDRARAHFIVADASDLPQAVLDEAASLRAGAAAGKASTAAGAAGGFDLVVVDDVLTELRQPLDLVRRLRAYVRAGGVVVIASSNDWRPEVTPRNSWLGGFKMNGEEMSTLHILKFHLKREFDFLETVDLARMSRENHRCFRMDVLEASIWRRRA